MPFPQRAVGPAARPGPPLCSLEQGSARALVRLLGQLAELSRGAGDIFGELGGQAAALGHRTAALRCRLDALHAAAAHLDPRREPVPVSNLDEESRWTVHYTAPWHQQENVFLPSTRPPCVENLHRQAQLNLKSVLRECATLRRDGRPGSQHWSQGPTFSACSSPAGTDYPHGDEETDPKCRISSLEEERLISIRRPKTPASSDFSDLNTRTNWTKSLPLPTPEEKMRQQAQTVQADVVPINVTGENFDRQASLRRSLIYTDTLVRRPKKVKRRKTITGVPDNIQKELESGAAPEDLGSSWMCSLEHCSTLGRRSETRDSSCQTEDMPVVPPSMRRIRAQRGQSLAAQMSHFSGSSGNVSVRSDPAGVVGPSFLHLAGFHSLPRPGTVAAAQGLEPRPGGRGPAEDAGSTFPSPGGHPHLEGNLEHFGGASGAGTLLRPAAQELRHLEGGPAGPACLVCPHATYSTSILPNARLPAASEVVLIHTALGHPAGPSYPKPKPRDTLTSRPPTIDAPRAARGLWGDSPSPAPSQILDARSPAGTSLLSLCHPATSLCPPASRENGVSALAYNCRNSLSFPSPPQDADGRSESSYSGCGGRGSPGPWEYQGSGARSASPQKPHARGSSSPTSPGSSCSLDQPSSREDAGSLHSGDPDGCHTPGPTDPGPGPGNLCARRDSFGNPRHSVVNVFDGRAQNAQADGRTCPEKSLSRNISLKKAKKPPLPPSRTDSLRRVPKKGSQPPGQVLSESLLASLEHSLRLGLRAPDGRSPSPRPCSDCDEPWPPRSRSQSTASAGSSLASAATPAACSLGAATPSQSDTSSVRSEYTDPWGYYIDYTGLQEEPGHPAALCLAGGRVPTGNGVARDVPDGSRAAGPQASSGASIKPKTASPEKLPRVTSPSSGYSSQSNTPTAVTPVPVFLRSMSPANGKGRARPKVPERKSSLISSLSISSSSTSLSSSTSTEGSGTLRKLDSGPACPPAPLSGPPPGAADRSPLPLPPPPLADSSDTCPLPRSPVFPPPPPEVLSAFCPPTDTCFSPPATSMSPDLPEPSASFQAPPPFSPSLLPPPAPPLDPKWLQDTRPSRALSSQPEASCSAFKEHAPREDSLRPPMPLITTEALQMVQLRPVRKNSGAEGERLAERIAQENPAPGVPQNHLKPSALLKSRNSINDMESQSRHASPSSSLPAPAWSPTQGHPRAGAAERDGPPSHRDRQPARAAGGTGTEAQPHQGTAPVPEQPDSPASRKPPPISKKPKLFLVVPPPQKDLPVRQVDDSHGALSAQPSPTREEAREAPAAGTSSNEPDSGGCPVLGAGAAGAAGAAASLGTAETHVPMVPSDAVPAPEQGEPGASEEDSTDDGGRLDRRLGLEDGRAALLETDAVASSSETCDALREDGGDEAVTPSRPRTTEDLFAAIHRSKRKVLGRKDSEDDPSRNHSPSPPVTPTGATPSLTPPKQVGSIQRSVRKSSTSSDNFKALLLKKGSRSDAGARMSAAEMLRSTDPRFRTPRPEPAADRPEPAASGSPGRPRRAQEEWARHEGWMPRSLSFSGARAGRSRTPPSAASSRYSVRHRTHGSAMTVISEGEGEPLEPGDARARRAAGTTRAGSLDGPAGPAVDQGEVSADPEGRDLSQQRAGPPREEG